MVGFVAIEHPVSAGESAAGEEPGQAPPKYRMGRRELLAMVSAIMAFTAVGIDLMLPAFDEMRAEFDLGEDSAQTTRTITVYFLGLAFGQLFFGPIADRFGRKPTLYLGAAVYVIGSIGSAAAGSFTLLLVARGVWGVGAAGARIVAVSIIRDRFEGAAMASAMSNVMAVFLLVPIFAPSIGAVIIGVLPWRSVFWFCAVFAVVILVWSIRLRETLDPANRRELNPSTIASGYLQVARTKITFGYTMAAVFIQAAFIVYVSSLELVVTNVFDRKEQFPVIFGAVGVIFGVASFINGRIVERLGIDVVVTRTLAWLGAVLVLFNGFILMSSDSPNFWVFMVLLGMVMGSFMFLMPNLGSAAMLPLGEIAGSGSALTGSVRTALGALIGGVLAERVDTSIDPMVLSLTLLMACTAGTVWLTRKGGLRALTRPT